MSKVLVLDSQAQNSLAISRSLGRKGLSVTAGGYARRLPGMLSRHTDDTYVYPNPSEDADAFVEDLHAHLDAHDYDAVFAVTDILTSILSRHRDRLEATGTRIGVEDWEHFVTANDKFRLSELADGTGVPHPRTWAPDSIDDVERIEREREGRVVVKPRRTTLFGENGDTYTNRMDGANYVAADEDLVARFREITNDDDGLRSVLPIVQEYVPGDETMCTVGLADSGELKAVFQHEKEHVYPPSGGIGAIRTGTWQPQMREYAERIVEALDWTGPVHVEFMRTPDGDFSLLEVNGRYWGATALAINSGVDVPWLHYLQLVGDPLPPIAYGEYRMDVHQRKLFYTDLLWLREELRRGRWSSLLPFAESFLTTREEFLDPTDPLPLLGVIPRTRNVLETRTDQR